jgi:hypothetical protein
MAYHSAFGAADCAFEARRAHFFGRVGALRVPGRCGAVSLPIFAKQKFFYSSPSIWFDRNFGSSCRKTCADYSGYKDCRKRGLIATVSDLLLRVFEGVAR